MRGHLRSYSPAKMFIDERVIVTRYHHAGTGEL